TPLKRTPRHNRERLHRQPAFPRGVSSLTDELRKTVGGVPVRERTILLVRQHQERFVGAARPIAADVAVKPGLRIRPEVPSVAARGTDTPKIPAGTSALATGLVKRWPCPLEQLTELGMREFFFLQE